MLVVPPVLSFMQMVKKSASVYFYGVSLFSRRENLLPGLWAEWSAFLFRLQG
jgi:hypothetical protein